MTYYSSYLIGAGHNVALVSLVNIESIVATGDGYRKFYAPQAIPHAAMGTRRGKLNGVGYRSGFYNVDWVFSVLTRNQYDYLSSTYCNSGLEGVVTIYTTVGKQTYARYNASIDLPPMDQIQNAFFAPHPVPVHFTHLVPL